MRCFIAIDLCDAVRQAVAGCIEQLEPLSRDIRWVPPANLHLTLKFLGEVSDVHVRDVNRRLQELAAVSAPFSLEVFGTGVFPNTRRPTVLWIGIQQSPGLVHLQEGVEKTLAQLGFPPEARRFAPHLTIGRVKGVRGVDAALKHLLTFQNAFFGSINVNEIMLMQSVLSPSGAIYSAVGRYQLGAAAADTAH